MLEEETPKRKKRRRKKLNKKLYFTKEHEDAILSYVTSTTQSEKEDLYRRLIQPVFNEMVDKIVFTYKFTTLPNIEDLKADCKVWLTTVLEKFNADKGSKAFSYFSVITKNWFIHKVKKNSYRNKKEITFDELPKMVEETHMITHNPYHGDREDWELRERLIQEIEDWGKMPMKANEEKVYKAILVLLENPEHIEIFNKKAIYLYIREITGLNTKQVVNNLNKLRNKYKVFISEWNDGNI
jgi:DNA-directed RNA polymerase specialized sigma subunit